MLVGLEAFLALRYKPQALHIVAPCGDLRHNGVLLVPQLLQPVSTFSHPGINVDAYLHTCPLGTEPGPKEVSGA